MCRYPSDETGVCGTARKNRLKVPKSMKDEPLEKGDHVFRCDGNQLMIQFLAKKKSTSSPPSTKQI